MKPSLGDLRGRKISREGEPVGRFLCTLYLAGTGLPLFVLPGYRTTNWTLAFDPAAAATLDRQPLRIHWCVALAAVVAVYFAIRVLDGRGMRAPRGALVGGLVLVFSLALAAGLATTPATLNVVYFTQTVAPMVGFLAGALLAASFDRLRTALLMLVATVTVSLFGILALALWYGALSGDVVAANRLAKAIPQLRDYFPFVVAASLSLAIGLARSAAGRRQRGLLAAAITVHLAFGSVIWSRMGLVMIAVVILAPLLLARRSTPRAERIVVAAAAICGLAVVSVLVVRSSVLGTRLGYASADDNATAGSDARRVRYAVEAVRAIARAPLFGKRFVADWELRVTGSRTEPLRIPRMFMAHNQYLDYGIRAGLPAMTLLVAIMVCVAVDLVRALAAAAAGRPLVVAVAGALTAVAAGNLTHLFLVQAQTGSLAWFLVGVSARLGQRARAGELGPPTDAGD